MPKLIDLSRTLIPGMPVYPGDPGFEVETVATYAKDGFQTSKWKMVSHLGTHIDSPLHYVPRGWSSDQIPLETFFGPAAVISLAEPLRKLRSTPAKITPAMLAKYDDAFRMGERILIHTGWEKAYGESQYFTSFPSLTPEAAQWIVKHNMKLLGFETPSVSSIRSEDENTASEDAICHRILLRDKPPVTILEGLVNLDQLPVWPATFTLSCFPWKVEGADGCPVRAVAILD